MCIFTAGTTDSCCVLYRELQFTSAPTFCQYGNSGVAFFKCPLSFPGMLVILRWPAGAQLRSINNSRFLGIGPFFLFPPRHLHWIPQRSRLYMMWCCHKENCFYGSAHCLHFFSLIYPLSLFKFCLVAHSECSQHSTGTIQAQNKRLPLPCL